MSKVICKWCGEQFEKEADTPKEKNRYYHKECYEKALAERVWIKRLTYLINDTYEKWGREPNWTLIVNQLEKMLKDGYTYSFLVGRMEGHIKSPYFDLDKAYGVGFLNYPPFDNEIASKEDATAFLMNSLEE